MEDIFAQLDQCKLLLENAQVGWWEANFHHRDFTCSDNLARLLGKKTGSLTFFDFYYLIREDFRDLITSDFLSLQTADGYEQVFPVNTPSGEKWVRSKLCKRELDDTGHVKGFGMMQLLPDFELKNEKINETLGHNEMIFRNLYTNLPVGVEVYDRDGFLVDMNTKDMEIFGVKSKKDVLGVNLFDNPILPKDIIKRLKQHKPVNFRISYPFKKIDSYYKSSRKGELDIVTKARVLYDNRGELSSYLLINLDNTEQTIAYNRISEFKNVFTLVSDYAKVGYALYDLYTHEGYAVKQWYENIGEEDGIPLTQLVGVYPHIHPDDVKEMNLFFDKVKSGKADHFQEELRVRTDSGWKWICANITRNPQSVNPDKPEMICVNYDITELKESKIKQEKAEELDRLKSAFLANMSHEIRTPLNAIVGFSQLLAETDDREEKHEFIEVIDSNNQLLLQLISDILDLAKIESGTLEFKFNEMDIREMVNEVMASFRIKMPAGVALCTSGDLPRCVIHSDHTRLIQVISNFINNAIKYTEQGSITLAYELNPELIRFSVTDTGDGMPSDVKAHIFDRFYKGNDFKQGTGLGLSICETIVKRLGGQIGVDSVLGQGSSFWFTVPNK